MSEFAYFVIIFRVEFGVYHCVPLYRLGEQPNESSKQM